MYLPITETPSIAGLRERARQNRDVYEQQSIARAQEADQMGYRNPNMFSNETRTRQQNAMSRAQQIGSPWDAWFQAVHEAGGGEPGGQMPVIGGGRSARAQNRELAADALEGEQAASQFSKYNVEGRARARGARPSLIALNGLSYLRG